MIFYGKMTIFIHCPIYRSLLNYNKNTISKCQFDAVTLGIIFQYSTFKHKSKPDFYVAYRKQPVKSLGYNHYLPLLWTQTDAKKRHIDQSFTLRNFGIPHWETQKKYKKEIPKAFWWLLLVKCGWLALANLSHQPLQIDLMWQKQEKNYIVCI